MWLFPFFLFLFFFFFFPSLSSRGRDPGRLLQLQTTIQFHIIDTAPLDFTVRSLCTLQQDSSRTIDHSVAFFFFFPFVLKDFFVTPVSSQINFPKLEQFSLNVIRNWTHFLLFTSYNFSAWHVAHSVLNY